MNMSFSIIYLIFLIHVKPMKDPSLNTLEIINELTLLICYYLCMAFSDFMDNIDIREKLGLLFIILVISDLSLGLVMVGKKVYYKLKKVFLRAWNWL